MSIEEPIPMDVAQIINMYVESELRDMRRFTNREPLDESGISGLHNAAARVYSLGYAAGRRYQNALADGERQRERERKESSDE